MVMDILGVKFAPLNTPLRRRKEILAEAGAMWLPILVCSFGFVLMTLLCCTTFGFVPLLYLTWIYIFDSKTPERGGRKIKWITNLKIYKMSKNYYPITLTIEPDLQLDAKRNYLFCSFPHGVMGKGVYSTIITNAHELDTIFPNHQRNFITLPMNFKIPFYRDYILAMGGCSSSARSIEYILKTPGGGRIAVLVVGGAEEAFYAHAGPYKLVLRNRKGFVKLALKNGSPLVPIFSFGENDLFRQVSNPKGSMLRQIQEWVKARVGATPVLVYGRGLLQYSFGFLPLRKPINVVVGKAIEVRKIEKPTNDEIDSLHALFIQELTKLFDKYKHQFIDKPEEHPLLII